MNSVPAAPRQTSDDADHWLRRTDLLLRRIDEGTAGVVGGEFFPSLVRNLAEALQVRHAFVSEIVEGRPARVRTLAFWKGDGFLDREVVPVNGARSEVMMC